MKIGAGAARWWVVACVSGISVVGACGSGAASGTAAPSGLPPEPELAAPAPGAPEPVVEVPLVQLAITPESFPIRGDSAGYDQVAYPAAVQQALLRELRTIVGESLEGYHVGTASYPSSFAADCHATLALPTLVAYACVTRIFEGRGGNTCLTSTHVWEVAGDTLRAEETDDLLVPGTDRRALERVYQVDGNGPSAPTASGLTFVDMNACEMREIPYADLGVLLNPRSILSVVGPAVAASSLATPFSSGAAPPSTVDVLSIPLPLGRAVFQRGLAEGGLLFAEAVESPIDRTSSVFVEADYAVEGTVVTERAWAPPARLVALTLRAPTPLHARPGGAADGGVLPAGTFVYGVLGELAAGPSRTSGGQWTLVVAGEEHVGWVRSSSLGGPPELPVSVSRDAFLALVPESELAAAHATTITIAVDHGFVHAARLGDESLVGHLRTARYDGPVTAMMVVRHAGLLADARLVPVSPAYGAPTLLLLAWLLPADPTHHVWEAYAMPTSGTVPEPAVFTVSLALPTGSEAERVAVVTALTRHGQYYPFVVRGPGDTETVYSWTHATLVAARSVPPESPAPTE